MDERIELLDHEHVRVAVTDADKPGAEYLPARRIRNNEWLLLRSPLYAMGVAAGDVVNVLDSEAGEIEIVTRGPNVCVQFYLREQDANDAQATEAVARLMELSMASIGGRVDGKTPGLISFTVPVAVGFPVIEQIFEDSVRRFPGAEWQYSNVYDLNSGEPIGWWESHAVRKE